MKIGNDVNLHSGKYAGRAAYFDGWTERNGVVLATVRVQTGLGWTTVLVKGENISPK